MLSVKCGAMTLCCVCNNLFQRVVLRTTMAIAAIIAVGYGTVVMQAVQFATDASTANLCGLIRFGHVLWTWLANGRVTPVTDNTLFTGGWHYW